MPDIDPAALSRPSISLSTPILSAKSITISAPGSQKLAKAIQVIPTRIDLEPLYTALKGAIESEQWATYKTSISDFLTGRLSQAEYSGRVYPILASPGGEKEHLHNQLIVAIYANVTREMPDPGLAPWVSANDKPAAVVASKPVTGDAAERRLKGEVMQLPNRDRRRIKELMHNDFDPRETLVSFFSDTLRRPVKAPDLQAPQSAINNKNPDSEMRKRYAQPLAVESGELPDINAIEGRMLPFCYESGLTNGHSADAPSFVSVAAETFIKRVLSDLFSRTCSNGPGESGPNPAAPWIQTHKYRRQLAREEAAAARGEITRDKSGLLPVESKVASEREPLSITDLQIAMGVADMGMAQFPTIQAGIRYSYREGEVEGWTDYTWLPGRNADGAGGVSKAPSATVNGVAKHPAANGPAADDPMDIDSDEPIWEGGSEQDMLALDGILDCLAVG